jgi:hypothetical protein
VKVLLSCLAPQNSEARLTISGGMVIHVKVGHEVDPYLEIHMHISMKVWRKKWCYLGKLQPLCEHLQQLWQEGFTGMHLLWPFFSHRIQPL